MSATYITQSIQQLKSNIFMHVRHRALLQNVGEPILDKEQLFFIQLPFLDGNSIDDERKMSAITVGIVHASLLEHEKIKEQNATSKQQQLTVLAGDYYSGRYYQLLAQSRNIHLIQKLSKGIVNRCEQQIKIYEPVTRPLSEWIESMSIIECELIEQYYEVYQFTQYKDLMKKTLTFLRLKEELSFVENGEKSFFNKQLHIDTLSSPTIQNALQEELMKRQDELHGIVKHIPIQPELKQYIEQLITS
ncbi:heptaprenyl diphosphate synthase [Solibacillus sp. R5-41]|uniref:heptaprenyl diphosphate synthase component 1 n=1 Tax=Solibacillus sp. R5-41 TaxID=2048654 RepID=UPI000C126480|nr:heptaprenyl diphosphate synthase component 1 [Solibacillus sp. R5-41]ATP39618.1 heptaprenyl diphosphate synthase [Solibacillus sp. R5-41]